MKHFKRIIATVLATTLMMSIIVPANAQYFSDVSPNRWSADSINYVSDNGIMSGTGDNQFSPSQNLTRSMIAMVIYSKAGRPSSSTNSGFSDVPSSAYYAAAVTWAKNNSIMSGTGGNLFEPDKTINRQDVAVVLHNYAAYEDYNVNATTSLSKFTDASDISSYAVSAVQWAISTKVMAGTSSTTFSPYTSVTREQIAAMITNYGLCVERIKFGRDNYGFTNSYGNFTRDCYYMTDDQFDQLCTYVSNYYGSQAGSYKQRLQDRRDRAWGGSCYGMAVTSILDKLGKIDLNGNYSNAKTMYDIKGSAVKGTSLEGAINYYQIAQAVPFLQHTRNYKQFQPAVHELEAAKGLSLFSYWWKSGEQTYGHAIVVYDLVQTSDGGYTLSAYDNRTTLPITITISADYSECIVNGTEDVTSIEVVTDFTPFDYIDIDTNTNTFPVNAVATEMENIDNQAELSIAMEGPFAITNAEGKTLTWDGNTLSGSMEIFNSYMTTEGLDTTSNLIVQVPSSASFQFTSENDNTYVALVQDAGYARVSGTGIATVTIDSTNTIDVYGNNMNYDVVYGANDVNDSLHEVNGTGDMFTTSD